MASAILADTSTKNRYADMRPEWRAQNAAGLIDDVTNRMEKIRALLTGIIALECEEEEIDRDFNLLTLAELAQELAGEISEIVSLRQLLAVGVPASKVEG